jgi:hypothetical protein
MGPGDLNLEQECRDLGLELRYDEFSVQISSIHDRLFWIRVDRDAPGAEVTDLNAGSTAAGVAAAGLDLALRAAGHDRADNIRFRDIASTGETTNRLSGVRLIVNSLAERRSLAVSDFQTSLTNGKIYVLVTFQSSHPTD